MKAMHTPLFLGIFKLFAPFDSTCCVLKVCHWCSSHRMWNSDFSSFLVKKVDKRRLVSEEWRLKGYQTETTCCVVLNNLNVPYDRVLRLSCRETQQLSSLHCSYSNSNCSILFVLLHVLLISQTTALWCDFSCFSCLASVALFSLVISVLGKIVTLTFPEFFLLTYILSISPSFIAAAALAHLKMYLQFKSYFIIL